MTRVFDIVIAARANGVDGLFVEHVPGKIVNCLSADGDFYMSKNNGPRVPIKANTVSGDSGSAEFGTLTFYNPTNNAISARVKVSDEPSEDERNVSAEINATVSAKDPPTYTKATGCAPNATTTFNGADAGKQRKQIVICNKEPDGGADITWSDNANAVLLVIPPRQDRTIITNGVVKVAVPAGAAAAAVIETFYS